jgi:hypothetical protein
MQWMTSSHVLFTDTSDVIWLASMLEIEDKYKGLGCPPVLMSKERSGLNAGGWIGERTAMIDALKMIAEVGGSGNPQVRWREAVDKQWLNVMLDEESRIFQVHDGTGLEFKERRVRNQETGTWPCLLHFAGGFSHPTSGKTEQMHPVMLELGYDV